MPTRTTCEREIRELHAFFVEWYCGRTGRDGFDRLGSALAAEFELVTPEGEILDREMLLDGIRESHGRNDPGAFDIDIRNVELIARFDDHALVRYEEWQTEGGDSNGRLSMALFRSDDRTPNGVRWITLQETWLEPPGERRNKN